MISSLVHVLIVTPVLVFSIRARQLGLAHQPLPAEAPRRVNRRVLIATGLLVAVVGGSYLGWRFTRHAATDAGSPDAGGRAVVTVRSGDMDIVLLSPTGTLRSGRNTLTIEFRSASGALVDVGTVRVSANMTMPGMVMPGNVHVQPAAGVPGRFTATAELGMAGTWPFSIEWDGPAGRGSVSFEGSVQ